MIIRKRRLQWLGHMERMEEDRMPHVLFDGRLKSKKKAFAGVRRRWVDVVKKDAETVGVGAEQLLELAEDRPKWRKTLWRA